MNFYELRSKFPQCWELAMDLANDCGMPTSVSEAADWPEPNYPVEQELARMGRLAAEVLVVGEDTERDAAMESTTQAVREWVYQLEEFMYGV